MKYGLEVVEALDVDYNYKELIEKLSHIRKLFSGENQNPLTHLDARKIQARLHQFQQFGSGGRSRQSAI